MINIEEELFSNVSNYVRKAIPNVYMVSEYVKSPPSFPCVSLIEMDNSIYTKTQTSEGDENHAQVMYEVNVYSNITKAKKSECKAIIYSFVPSSFWPLTAPIISLYVKIAYTGVPFEKLLGI